MAIISKKALEEQGAIVRNQRTFTPPRTVEEKEAFKAERQEKLNDFVKEVAADLITLIGSTAQSGQKWVRPWPGNPLGEMPFNPLTEHRYTRGNVLRLLLANQHNSWGDPRFMTFKQVKTYGDKLSNDWFTSLEQDEQGEILGDAPGKNRLSLIRKAYTRCVGPLPHVKKGMRGTTILRPIVKEYIKERDAQEEQESSAKKELEELEEPQGNESAEQETTKIVFFRPIPVFNACQIEGMPQPTVERGPRDWESDQSIQRLIQGSGAEVQRGGFSCFFDIPEDKIRLPEEDVFDTPEGANSMALHEWFHWTGGPDREDRLTAKSKDDPEYAMEELRAETFSYVSSILLGLPVECERHAGYLAYWNKQLESDPKAILEAASDSMGMIQAAMDFWADEQPAVSWFPDKSTWPDKETLEQPEVHKKPSIGSVAQDVSSLSSGTMANLIGEKDLRTIDRVQQAFVAFAQGDSESTTWAECWEAFRTTPELSNALKDEESAEATRSAYEDLVPSNDPLDSLANDALEHGFQVLEKCQEDGTIVVGLSGGDEMFGMPSQADLGKAHAFVDNLQLERPGIDAVVETRDSTTIIRVDTQSLDQSEDVQMSAGM